jgi:GntR family transcriptional regulator
VVASIQARLRTDQRPLYAQASEALKHLVLRGDYAPGERLPSEHELSSQLGISRPTLREGLRLLEEEGVIIRRHGVGTFVAERLPVIEGGLEVLESIDRLAERRGLRTSMGALEIRQRSATQRELIGLNLERDTPITMVKRVILVDGKPVAALTDIVPQDCLSPEELRSPDRPDGFRGSVLEWFLARGWPLLSHSLTELAAEPADAELARGLDIPRGAALMKLEAQLFATDGRVIDYSISHFAPGCFRFHVVRRIAGA